MKKQRYEVSLTSSSQLDKDSEPNGSSRSPYGQFFEPFFHPELLVDLENAAVVKRKDLVNRINCLHFTGNALSLYVQHTKYRDEFLVPVFPAPCDGNTIRCRLPLNRGKLLEQFTIKNLFVPAGSNLLVVPANLQLLEENSVVFGLPENNYLVNQRRNQRFASRGLTAVLCQNAFQAFGELVDFSPIGLRIRIDKKSMSSMRWFNPDLPVLLHLCQERHTVLTAMCPCIRVDRRPGCPPHIVLEPGNKYGHQFSKKTVRNPRQQLKTSLLVSFRHPFHKKKIRREIHDITTSGFSIVEDVNESVLLPGLILTDLSIIYAGVFELECNVTQVVYRVRLNDKKVRCGVAILDMTIDTYTKLANILSNALDPHTQISCDVDVDDLWGFFFESGFIYPQKYHSIQHNKTEFKKTYKKLYEKNPEIARHFTCQKNGRIYGHISLVRAYEKTWMFHHLLATSMDGKRTGPTVIKQITHFTLDMHRLPSANMDYMMCYYQPTNRFSSYLFSGVADRIDNRRICSQDCFSYFEVTKGQHPSPLPTGWEIDHFSNGDLFELRQYYEHVSGGLLLDVLNLDGKSTVEAAYKRCHFTRLKKAYSLIYKGRLKSVLLVNQTDLGFNLSSLLNCVKVIVCDADGISWEILRAAIEMLIGIFSSDTIPILLYPTSFLAKKESSQSSKEYFLWIIDARHVGDFMLTTKKIGKIAHWE